MSVLKSNILPRLTGLLKYLLVGSLTLVGITLYRAGLGRLVARLNRKAPKVLMLHCCEQTETDFTRGLAINATPSQFASHLQFLSRYYRIIPLAELMLGSPPEYAVAITFDDGFLSVYEQAWPLLRSRGFAATCCLTTDVIGNRALIWINELNWFLHRHGEVARSIVAGLLRLSPRLSASELVESARLLKDPCKTREILKRLRAEIGCDPAATARSHRLHVDWNEIEEMAAGGMTFGNHTCSHPMLENLTEDQARAEIREAGSVLARLTGACQILAYPFGSHNASTVRIARELGYVCLLKVEGTNSPLDLASIGRINVSSMSTAALFARMEIVEPVKSALKRGFRRASRRQPAASSRSLPP